MQIYISSYLIFLLFLIFVLKKTGWRLQAVVLALKQFPVSSLDHCNLDWTIKFPSTLLYIRYLSTSNGNRASISKAPNKAKMKGFVLYQFICTRSLSLPPNIDCAQKTQYGTLWIHAIDVKYFNARVHLASPGFSPTQNQLQIVISFL